MSASPQTVTSNSTAAYIRELAAQHHVTYLPTQTDMLADDITRLAGDFVKLDEVERLLIGLQRAGHLTRNQLVHLQAQYLRDAKL
jgi:hypothetical protein